MTRISSFVGRLERWAERQGLFCEVHCSNLSNSQYVTLTFGEDLEDEVKNGSEFRLTIRVSDHDSFTAAFNHEEPDYEIRSFDKPTMDALKAAVTADVKAFTAKHGFKTQADYDAEAAERAASRAAFYAEIDRLLALGDGAIDPTKRMRRVDEKIYAHIVHVCTDGDCAFTHEQCIACDVAEHRRKAKAKGNVEAAR